MPMTAGLDDLGPRICIIGPSNSGKSTLAQAIGAARGMPVVHLDTLFHLPNTDWEARPLEEFIALHDAAIAADRWVMEGNYSRTFPQRFARASGLILIDIGMGRSLWRYTRRTVLERDRRIGGLAGNRDSIKADMLRHIIGPMQAARRRQAVVFAESTLPKIALLSPAALNRFYAAAGLTR